MVTSKMKDELFHACLYAAPLIMSEAVAFGNPRNTFTHKPGPADANRRIVARPGVDQVASYAWLDLATTPFVLETPPSFSAEYPEGRYCSYQIMDAWTNVVEMLGAGFVNGNHGGTYVFVGPNYKGEVPAEMHRVDCPTNLAIVWSRTFCLDLLEMPKINEFKAGMKIYPLYPEQYVPAPVPKFPAEQNDPVAMLASLDVETYFNFFNELSTLYAPFDYDQPILETIKKYGIGPGLTFRLSQFEGEERDWVEHELIPSMLRQAAPMMWEDSKQVNQWFYSPDDLARYRTNYRLRGAVCITGYAANPTEVVQYFTSEKDADGNQLVGGGRYRIRFEKGKFPPIGKDGYWSLVAYDGKDYYLMQNPMERYRLSGISKELHYNGDGSLDLLIQDAPPEDKMLGNYLPACTDGPYCLCLRLYLPLEAVTNQNWVPPVIERLA